MFRQDCGWVSGARVGTAGCSVTGLAAAAANWANDSQAMDLVGLRTVGGTKWSPSVVRTH